MSYQRSIENSIVVFGEEIDFLKCRLQYLEYCKDAVTPEVSFLLYISNGMYEEGSVNVENIYDTTLPDTTSNTVIGNFESFDTATYASPSSVPHGYYTTYTYVDPGAGEQDVLHYYDMDTGQIHPAESSWTSTSSTFSNASMYDTDGLTWMFNENIVQNANKKVEKKIEEPPEDPINNRFDILDL